MLQRQVSPYCWNQRGGLSILRQGSLLFCEFPDMALNTYFESYCLTMVDFHEFCRWRVTEVWTWLMLRKAEIESIGVRLSAESIHIRKPYLVEAIVVVGNLYLYRDRHDRNLRQAEE